MVRDVRTIDGRVVDIACAGGVVEAVGLEVDAPGVETLDGGGGLVTRPFSDPHLHLDKAGTAGLLPHGAGTLDEAIRTMRAVKENERGDVPGVSARMASVLSGIVVGGTRAVRVVVDVDETWGLTAFRAALAIKVAFAHECSVRIVAFPQDGLTPAVARMLEEAATDGADAIGAHTDVDRDATAHLERALSIAAAAGLPVEVHTDEGAAPDRFYLPLVLDALDRHPGVAATLVHCLSLGTLPIAEQSRWIAELADRRLPVCVAPSVLALGVPIAPVRRLLEAGVAVLVGSDNLHDVFCPLGTGRAVENARMVAVVGQLTHGELLGPLVGGITDVAFATVTGARAAIEPGSPATFVVHRASAPVELLRGTDGLRLSVWNGTPERTAAAVTEGALR